MSGCSIRDTYNPVTKKCSKSFLEMARAGVSNLTVSKNNKEKNTHKPTTQKG